jgi:hypothetical protein
MEAIRRAQHDGGTTNGSILELKLGGKLEWYLFTPSCCSRRMNRNAKRPKSVQSAYEVESTKRWHGYCNAYSRRIGERSDNVTPIPDDKTQIFVEWQRNIQTVAIHYRLGDLRPQEGQYADSFDPSMTDREIALSLRLAPSPSNKSRAFCQTTWNHLQSSFVGHDPSEGEGSSGRTVTSEMCFACSVMTAMAMLQGS